MTDGQTIISLDCESNGLHGQIFAFAATLWVAGFEVSAVAARCPIDGYIDPWVSDNVLPALSAVPIDATSEWALFVRWREAYEVWTAAHPDALVVAHVAWPIETRFLWGAHKAKAFSGPFPLIDVASMLHQAGEDPTSVDGYLTKRSILLPVGSPHHPLYDCRAAALAYFSLLGACARLEADHA